MDRNSSVLHVAGRHAAIPRQRQACPRVLRPALRHSARGRPVGMVRSQFGWVLAWADDPRRTTNHHGRLMDPVVLAATTVRHNVSATDLASWPRRGRPSMWRGLGSPHHSGRRGVGTALGGSTAVVSAGASQRVQLRQHRPVCWGWCYGRWQLRLLYGGGGGAVISAACDEGEKPWKTIMCPSHSDILLLLPLLPLLLLLLLLLLLILPLLHLLLLLLLPPFPPSLPISVQTSSVPSRQSSEASCSCSPHRRA